MNSLLKTTILVIEDDKGVRQTLTDMLEVNGYRVVTAVNGLDGIAAARREAPSLIISDVAMPGMTGFELLDQIRGDEVLRTIPVIVISARRERAAIRRGMELGAADFISKPFTEDEVIHSIATRLEKKALVDELDAFAHTVAHDLKNPLSTLGGRIDLLGEMLGHSDEAALRFQVREATHAANRLNGIIDELLILAGVRRHTVIPAPLAMAPIVAEATDRLADLLQRQSARIHAPDTWPEALGHAPWITQVWVNYISNAAKYGGDKPEITLGGATSADGFFARFWVQDHGPGFDEPTQQKMFRPFALIANGRSNSHGLGLSIVRRIVEKLGGQVGVVSAPGAGARYWFELPAPLPPPTSQPPWSNAP